MTDQIKKPIKKKKTVKKNGKKNGREATQFSSQNQPSPDAKKAGWDRRSYAQSMMNTLAEYMSLGQEDFAKLLLDMKKHPNKYTVLQGMLYKYATKAFNGEKFMLDWVDRNISKAPLQHTGEDGADIGIRIKVSREGVETPTEE